MTVQRKRTVVLGVCGSIAAYKAAELARQLVKVGLNVKVVMTKAATSFVAPLTFETIARNPVSSSLFQSKPAGEISHVSLADEADLVLVAPATANILAKVAQGVADCFLSTLILSSTSPAIFAPAMNEKMYLNETTQENLKVLKQKGYAIVEPQVGELACGAEGIGRLAEISEIITQTLSELKRSKSLKGKKIIVTAGPTYEPIDAVRFISNRSSGKMGYALAREAAKRGAEVTLVSGPTALFPPPEVKLISVNTAKEMRKAVLANFSKASAVIKAAAVADFAPQVLSKHKIKKRKSFTLELAENVDILKELGKKKKKNQVLIGFAAESQSLKLEAKRKLKDKNLDLVVGVDITKENSGFGQDRIEFVLFDKKYQKDYSLMTKQEAASIILDKVAELLK